MNFQINLIRQKSNGTYLDCFDEIESYKIRKKDYTLVPSKYIQFSDDEKFEHLDDDLDELKDQILRKLLLDMEVNKSLLSIIQEES